MKTRRLLDEDFSHLLLQHTLSRAFRRAHNSGFLHGITKRLLKIVQWALQVVIPKPEEKPRPRFTCLQCHAVMNIVGFGSPPFPPG